jgi:hypothetical protein
LDGVQNKKYHEWSREGRGRTIWNVEGKNAVQKNELVNSILENLRKKKRKGARREWGSGCATTQMGEGEKGAWVG